MNEYNWMQLITPTKSWLPSQKTKQKSGMCWWVDARLCKRIISANGSMKIISLIIIKSIKNCYYTGWNLNITYSGSVSTKDLVWSSHICPFQTSGNTSRTLLTDLFRTQLLTGHANLQKFHIANTPLWDCVAPESVEYVLVSCSKYKAARIPLMKYNYMAWLPQSLTFFHGE